ncbi:MAG: OB-fold nucleic acid binding domain-containing protein, partial [Cyclobacteriaceae bacterium]
MLRTHTCGELRKSHVGESVTLTGWVQRVRDKGGMLWIDLRDKFGLTQLVFEEGKTHENVLKQARKAGREFVLSVTGKVSERYAKNDKLPTGDIEVVVETYSCLNESKVPPFIIEDETDGGEDLRMKYRYLDLRRNPVRKGLELRHKIMSETR